MGARAQVHIQDNGVYLYTHWGSGSIIEDVQIALESEAGQNRLDDPDYLARIIFDVMKRSDPIGETGFGIGTAEHDDNDLIVVLNCNERLITIVHHAWNDAGERQRISEQYSLSKFLQSED